MVRILRIISFIFTCSVGIIAVWVLVLALRPCTDFPKELFCVSVLEGFKKDSENFTQQEASESPLVIQAKLFALRIDPPQPIEKNIPKPPKEHVVSGDPGDPVIVPPILPKEIQLLGTVNYVDHPEKSLALVSLASGDYKWVRLGEQFEKSTVGEIKDGKIILYKDAIKYKNLFVPAPQCSLKPLLKN